MNPKSIVVSKGLVADFVQGGLAHSDYNSVLSELPQHASQGETDARTTASYKNNRFVALGMFSSLDDMKPLKHRLDYSNLESEDKGRTCK